MIDFVNNHIEVKKGNIYWYNFNNAFMPVMVIQNDIGNKYSLNTIIIKLSSSDKVSGKFNKIPTIIKFSIEDIILYNKYKGNLNDIGYALASDIHTVKKDTLKLFIGRFNNETISLIDKALKISLDLKDQKAYI